MFVLLAGIARRVEELERKSSVSLVLLHFHGKQTGELFFNGCVVVNCLSTIIFFIVMDRTQKQLIHIKSKFLSVFAKLREATVIFMTVCPSVLMENLGPHLDEFW